MAALLDKIGNDLNERQLDAVTAVDGPLLILAGAGSGKTRVLTYRAAYLIAEHGISPFNILAVTFTNKAANEMKNRMEALVGPAVRDMQVSTFHSFGVRILRRFGDRLGLKRDFSIYDEEDSLNLIKRCMDDLHIALKTHSPRAVREFISSAKDKLIDPVQYAETAKAYFNQIVAKVYERYQDRLERASALDFDDLLCKTVVMLQRNPDVLDSLQNKYRYIMVDEYQDTNHVQYLLVKLLGERERNVCVVGDDDQSIYGWRGADIMNILDFEHDFPGCKVVKLEQNYRSTKTILQAASEVVRNNRSRKGKTLFSEGADGEKIRLLVCDRDRDEAELVADKIEELISKGMANRKEIAILYRTNAQSRALEETLKNRFIPYTIVGGVRFYQRKEIKDALAYLKILTNPYDIISLRRVINYPTRGIGQVAQAKIEAEALDKHISPVELILTDKDCSFLKGKARTGLQQFAQTLRDMVAIKEKEIPTGLVREIIQRSGILRDIESGDRVEAESRKENLDELIAAVEEYCQQNDGTDIESFLEEIALYTDIDAWDNSADSVTLMTLHSAKGLEFTGVFITGLEEGLFPLAKALETENELEEERRLFYVGITRAEKYLYISYAKMRRRFGEMLSIESRFIDELPEDLIEREESFSSRPVARPVDRFHTQEAELIGDDKYENLQPGRWVMHPTWGEGKIITRKGMDDTTEVDVLFRYGGRKTVLAKYANLRVIS
jgi:DNA helicase-2/ATP-dependent DNA helicase PcrA